MLIGVLIERPRLLLETNRHKSSVLTEGWSVLNKELGDKYLEQMKTCKWEGDHEDADFILCELLEELGYVELIEAYKKVPKWYS